MQKSLYLAPFKHEDDLLKELAFKKINVLETKGRVILAEGLREDIIWSQSSWIDVKCMPISSIKDGAKKLKDLNRNWALYSIDHHRRSELIQSELPHYPVKPIAFLQPRPNTPMGGWTLWEHDLVLASTKTSSLYPIGEMTFHEDQINPPSRAYLKLWEFFTCHSPRTPRADEHLLDMGACPGGWTWVLQSFGGSVTAVDKAPLEKRIAELPRVSVLNESAFGLAPNRLAKVDWFFSDIICYPERLHSLVRHWREAGVKNFVCTIKYQAETDFEITHKFLETYGGKIIHQHHNKHEVTWFLIEN